MKVAVCLKGQPRNYNVGFNSINKYFIQKYNADIFGHAWWDKNKVGQEYFHAPWATSNKIPDNLDIILPQLYKFKSFQIESDKQFEIKQQYKILPGIPQEHDRFIQILLSSYYSLKRVLELLENYEKENGFEYDWVFITRYDVGIFKFIEDLSKLDKDKIYVSPMHKRRPYIFNDCGYLMSNHRFVFKNMFDNFDYNYNKIINLAEDYKKEAHYDPELLRTTMLSGEGNIAFHFLFNGVLNKVVKHTDMDYNLIREGQDPNVQHYPH